MSTKERTPRRTLDQDFIYNAVKLVTQEGYKNARDRATYPTEKTPGRDDREIATIDHETKKPLDSQGNQGCSLIGPTRRLLNFFIGAGTRA